MPFTPAHAAAAVPIWRCSVRRLALSGLVVGSLSPDFEYFIGLLASRTISHSLLGVFVLDLPASLVVLWAFHRLIKAPLLLLLPARLANLRPLLNTDFRFGPPSRFLMISVSILIGAFSHLAWDACTHAEGWVVMHLPPLRGTIEGFGGFSAPLYRILQDGSGVVGLALLGWWVARWIRRRPMIESPDEMPRLWRYVSLFLLTSASVAAALANAVLKYLHTGGHASPRSLLEAAAIGSISGLCAAVLVYTFAMHRCGSRLVARRGRGSYLTLNRFFSRSCL